MKKQFPIRLLTILKKIIITVLSATLLLSAVGCSKANNDKTPDSKTEAQASAKEDTTLTMKSVFGWILSLNHFY